MKVPRYYRSSISGNIQRRLFMALLVALLAMVSGFLIYPWVAKQRQLRALDSNDVVARVRALNSLCRLARTDASLLNTVEMSITDLLSNDAENVRAPVIRIAAWSVHNLPTMHERLERQLNTSDDVVYAGIAAALREAGVWEDPTRSEAQLCRLAAINCAHSDEAHLPLALAGLAALGPTCADHAAPILTELLQHSSEAVRLSAVEAVSICLPRRRIALLSTATLDESARVRSEAAARLALLQPAANESTAFKVKSNELCEQLKTGDYFSRLRAMEQIRQTPFINLEDSQRLTEVLRALAQEGLQTGNGGLAGYALTTLAHLGDQAFLQVMVDVAGTPTDQPMLRFLAARAAAQLDPESGITALANLISMDNDDVRDLAAFELARINHPAVVRRLAAELFSTALTQRGPAAWALALKGDPDLQVHDYTLQQLLLARTSLESDNIHAEVDWKPRGYYLCARRLLGDPDLGDQLSLLLLNEHFPRLAIYTTMLHSGEASVLDVALGTDVSAAELIVPLIRDRGFGHILSHYIPDAPTVDFSSPPVARLEATRQLIRFWSMFRWQLEFDTRAHIYHVKETTGERKQEDGR